MLKSRKISAVILTLVILCGTLFAGQTMMSAQAEETFAAADVTPRQVNAHFGDDASTQMNISYTTLTSAPSVVIYRKAGETATLEARGLSSQGTNNKYFHGVAVTGLTPGTDYEYTVGSGEGAFTGRFKTAPAKGSNESFTFAYLADTQVSNATNAESLGANLQSVADGGYDFVYLAGDHTDTAANESQWEWLFNNGGAFPNGGQNMYGSYAVSLIQGNHDNNTFARHVNAPAQQGNIVYTFEYGPATFIMLNLEAARSDATARDRQEEFLRATVADAKQRGQWTFVGYHKSLYTGASHITDTDVISARKFWCPIFAELDVDFVLQGHDHVYSRGFVEADGSKAIDAPKGSEVESPDNAPLYMIGGHAGGLKWYSRKNYTVGTDDPLLPGYSFLDVDSAAEGSDTKEEQWTVSLEVSNEEVSIVATAFKYDESSDTITTPKYTYDTLTVTRDVPPQKDITAEITGPEEFITDSYEDAVAEYTVKADKVSGANAFAIKVNYDAAKYEFKGVQSLIPNTVISSPTDNNGTVTAYIGSSRGLAADSAEIAKLTFAPKGDYVAVPTTVTLAELTAAIPREGGGIADEYNAEITKASVETVLHSMEKACDINGDGRVTLSDLSLSLSDFQTEEGRSDINLDGVVDTADYIIITRYIA